MESDKEIISRLKFIGMLQPDQKICTRDLTIQSQGVIDRIFRTINADNRANTLAFVQNTISRSFEIIQEYSSKTEDSLKQFLCISLIKDLRNSKIGISNLKATYKTDVKFSCDIDVLMESIDAKLIECKPVFDRLVIRFEQHNEDSQMDEY